MRLHREFLRGGAASFIVGSVGVIVPFFVGYYAFTLYGLAVLESVLVATALTATSIAISVQMLSELGKIQTKETRLILGAAFVDDILAIAVLSVVTTMVQTGNIAPDISEITFLILKILGLFVVLLVGAVILVPRILHITTAAFFGAAGIAALVGLSPIV
ncbi:MAG: cation:proton antiporter [Nitrososphaeraceae archaeon]